jgi:hypothetical protein
MRWLAAVPEVRWTLTIAVLVAVPRCSRSWPSWALGPNKPVLHRVLLNTVRRFAASLGITVVGTCYIAVIAIQLRLLDTADHVRR